MGKIISKISIGNKKLLVSENFVFIPEDIVKIEIPTTTTAPPLIFEFEFADDDSKEFKTSTESFGNTLRTKLVNTKQQPLGVASTTWHSFTLGNERFFYAISVFVVASKGVNFSFSLYSKGGEL